jgi:hypothetical protein
MKQITTLLAFMLLATVSLKATVHTVSNDPNQPAQWTNLQNACNNANAGDTIYVQGSPTDYGNFSIKKKLHIIGAGIKPYPNTSNSYSSKVGTISLDTVSYTSGASGTIIEGMTIGIINSFVGCKNITLRRNYFYFLNYSTVNLYNITNLLVYNNMVFSYNFTISASTNVLIMNNIVGCGISNGSTTTTISNNVFVRNGAQAFGACDISTITNNIFYYSEVAGATNCTFSNNIGIGISTNVLQGTNTGGGNIMGDPKFVYKYTGNSYNDLDNFHLQATSPGKNAGTDATDIGIYGGQYPFPVNSIPNFINCIPPTIPVVQELVIQNSSVPGNGNLNFSVKARKASK